MFDLEKVIKLIIKCLTCAGISLFILGGIHSKSYVSIICWVLAIFCLTDFKDNIEVLKDIKGRYYVIATVVLFLIGLMNIKGVEVEKSASQVPEIIEESKEEADEVVAKTFEEQKEENNIEQSDEIDAEQIEDDGEEISDDIVEEENIDSEEPEIDPVEMLEENLNENQILIENNDETIKQIESEEEISELTEEEKYKSSCMAMTYRRLNKMSDSSEMYSNTYRDSNVCCCVTIGNKIEGNSFYGIERGAVKKNNENVYKFFIIDDQREEKDFKLIPGTVVNIYGHVNKIKYNENQGLYYFVIDVKYAEYMEQLTDEEIKKSSGVYKEIDKRKKIEEELDRLNSIYSDYTGVSKNIVGMEDLSEAEFKSYCDELNMHDMNDENNAIYGTYVKLHMKVKERKVINYQGSDLLEKFDGKYTIKDNLIYASFYNERTNKYELHHMVLFNENCNVDAYNLKKDQEIIVYGRVIKCSYISTGNSFKILAFYVE